MQKRLNRILAHIDMAQGTPFSRFNNPGYLPTDDDIDEAINRIDALIGQMSRQMEANARLLKEAEAQNAKP